MAIRVERDAATEDDGDRFFNAAVGEREYLVGFLSKGLDSGLKLRMLEDTGGFCYTMHSIIS